MLSPVAFLPNALVTSLSSTSDMLNTESVDANPSQVKKWLNIAYC